MRIKKLKPFSEDQSKVLRFLEEWNNDSQWISQQTSGSTGPPKTIEIEKWKMKASAKMTGEALRLDRCDSALLCMSVDYIGGKMMVVRSHLYELDLYVTNVTRNPLVNLDFPIDFAAMVPLQVEAILEESPEKLNYIKHLIIGGAPVSDQLIEKIKKFDCKAYSTFGMTETVSHIALRELKNLEEAYRVIGDTRLSTKEKCLTISCEELGIKDLQTTDVVELIDEKTFHWLGRADFVINSGGVKIHPEKVERKIAAQTGLTDFIIGSIPDQKLGNKVVFIGEESIIDAVNKDEIDQLLSPYERPKEYFYLSSLLKTESGKIDRKATSSAIQ